MDGGTLKFTRPKKTMSLVNPIIHGTDNRGGTEVGFVFYTADDAHSFVEQSISATEHGYEQRFRMFEKLRNAGPYLPLLNTSPISRERRWRQATDGGRHSPVDVPMQPENVTPPYSDGGTSRQLKVAITVSAYIEHDCLEYLNFNQTVLDSKLAKQLPVHQELLSLFVAELHDHLEAGLPGTKFCFTNKKLVVEQQKLEAQKKEIQTEYDQIVGRLNADEDADVQKLDGLWETLEKLENAEKAVGEKLVRTTTAYEKLTETVKFESQTIDTPTIDLSQGWPQAIDWAFNMPSRTRPTGHTKSNCERVSLASVIWPDTLGK
jgi:hypothetical protein